MKVRKFKTAKTKKPAGVPNIDLSYCIKGLVYNIYQCGSCIYEHKEDIARKSRTKTIYIKKKKKQIPCCTEHREPLLIKYKKCPCGQEYWGFYLHEHPSCKICGSFALNNVTEKAGRKYYRLGEFYKKTADDLSDEDRWNCYHRSLCLECTYKSGSKKAIACKNCPHYIKGTI